jgi:hypothetical protein
MKKYIDKNKSICDTKLRTSRRTVMKLKLFLMGRFGIGLALVLSIIACETFSALKDQAVSDNTRQEITLLKEKQKGEKLEIKFRCSTYMPAHFSVSSDKKQGKTNINSMELYFENGEHISIADTEPLFIKNAFGIFSFRQGNFLLTQAQISLIKESNILELGCWEDNRRYKVSADDLGKIKASFDTDGYKIITKDDPIIGIWKTSSDEKNLPKGWYNVFQIENEFGTLRGYNKKNTERFNKIRMAVLFQGTEYLIIPFPDGIHIKYTLENNNKLVPTFSKEYIYFRE